MAISVFPIDTENYFFFLPQLVQVFNNPEFKEPQGWQPFFLLS